MTTATKESKVARRLEDDGEYREWQTTLNRLVKEQDAREQRLREAQAAHYRGITHDENKRLVDAMIDGTPIDTAEQQRQRESGVQLLKEIRLGKLAIEEWKKRRTPIVERYSRQVIEATAPEYRRLVRAHVEAAVALSKTATDMKQYRDGLAERGVEFMGGVRPMDFRNAGDLDDHESHVCCKLREAVQHGFLTVNDPLVKGTAAINGAEVFPY